MLHFVRNYIVLRILNENTPGRVKTTAVVWCSITLCIYHTHTLYAYHDILMFHYFHLALD